MRTYSYVPPSHRFRPYELPGEYDPALVDQCEREKIDLFDDEFCFKGGIHEIWHNGASYWLCDDCEEEYHEKIKEDET